MALRAGVELIAPLEVGREESERQWVGCAVVLLGRQGGSDAFGMAWHVTTVVAPGPSVIGACTNGVSAR